MTLQDIFDQLTFGELAQLSIGGGEAGQISAANYKRVVAQVNLGLTTLYKRFALKENALVVQLIDGRTDYPIHSRHAQHNDWSEESQRFIEDAIDAPFKDDVLKIERVYGESGHEFALNDLNDLYALLTPSATLLRVPIEIVSRQPALPEPLVTSTLRVVYRANHPLIRVDDGHVDINGSEDYVHPDEIELELPYSHLEPLLLFVACRMHTPTGMSEQGNIGNVYMQKYELACQQIEQLNLRVDQGSQSNRLTRSGWV